MDYTNEKFMFKIRKVGRYIKLYGLNRTILKVKGQLHMKKQYDTLHENKFRTTAKQKIAIIGCGNYAFTTLAYYISKYHKGIIRACMDVDLNRAISLSATYKIPIATTDVNVILNDKDIELVYISSNHSTHAEYAIRCLKSGKNVYIEKPHVVNYKQLDALAETVKIEGLKVFLGFNRPTSRFGSLIKKNIDLEEGPGMFNWFVAGHKIEAGNWYFKPEEGGRVLGNLCHWTDFLYRVVYNNSSIIQINPTRHEKSDSDIIVTLKDEIGNLSVITFSAKGHTFEGVKEIFTAHKGNCLIHMKDFKELIIERNEKKMNYKNVYRDHGHKRNIRNALDNVLLNLPYNKEDTLSAIYQTGLLFLKIKESLENKTTISVCLKNSIDMCEDNDKDKAILCTRTVKAR